MRKFNVLTGRESEHGNDRADDGELIAQVRAGDNDAFGVLFDRHHAAAVRMARRVAPSADTDDLVSESFLQMFLQLQNGAGPDLAFRAYLFTSIRNLATKYARARDRIRPIDEETALEPESDLADVALAEVDNAIMRDAFDSLPERWQVVLWHLEVEREKPRDIAVSLGMKPNSVSALAHRARAGLRDHYLQQHLKLPADASGNDCQYVRSHLAAYVRSASMRHDCGRITRHLDECAECARVHDEIKDVDSRLGGVMLPILLLALLGGGLAGSIQIASGVVEFALATGAILRQGLLWVSPLVAVVPALLIRLGFVAAVAVPLMVALRRPLRAIAVAARLVRDPAGKARDGVAAVRS